MPHAEPRMIILVEDEPLVRIFLVRPYLLDTVIEAIQQMAPPQVVRACTERHANPIIHHSPIRSDRP
jgi:hypothetical protein